MAEDMTAALEPQIMPKPSEEKVDEKRELEDILRTILLMRLNAVNTQVQEYRFLQDQQEAEGDKTDQKSLPDQSGRPHPPARCNLTRPWPPHCSLTDK